MLRPIEVMALDENMNRASGGIAYRSLIWKRRYYECGTFELYVPKNIYKPTWKYIYTADRPETGVIETVSATDDVHAWGGIDTVKVSGRFAESLLSRKVLIPSRVTGYGSAGDNVAVSMQWAQEIFGDRFEYLAPDFEGVERAMAPKPAPYGGILYDELKMAEASYRVLYDFAGNTWTVQPWRGLDRTQSQLPIAPDPDEPDDPDEPTIDELYESLDYIVSTGEQWIDTGVIPDADTCAYISLVPTAVPSSFVWFLGSRQTSSGGRFSAYYTASSDAVAFGFSDTYGYVTDSLKIGEKYEIEIDGNTCSVNGDSLTLDASTFTSNYSIYLLAENKVGTATYPASARLFACTIESGSEKRNYVPKRRISDGAVGMLDLVNEVFYESASGVAFLAPGELPAGHTRLEHIESTGSQYIDTGFAPSSDTRTVMDVETVGVTSMKCLFGTRNAASATASLAYAVWQSSATDARSDYFGTSGSVSGTFDTRMIVDKNKHTYTVNGVSASNTEVSGKQATLSMYLLACNNSGTATMSYMVSAMLYSCQMYEAGVSIRDYVPAKDSSGEAGLFDLVTMTFSPDASGTGFVAGPEVTAVAEASTFSLMSTVAAIEETTETTAINSFALFSDQMGTIRDYVAVKDASGYKNACVIGYEYEEPEWIGDVPRVDPLYEWDDSGYVKTLVGWQIPYHITRGHVIARIEDGNPDDETYLDLTSTKPPYDQEWSRSKYPADAEFSFPADMRASYAAFPDSLKAEGFKHLAAEFPMVEEIDTGELSTGGYLRRWDLGDKVDALLLDIGIDMEARITGVDEAYEGKTRSVVPIIGEKKHRRL